VVVLRQYISDGQIAPWRKIKAIRRDLGISVRKSRNTAGKLQRRNNAKFYISNAGSARLSDGVSTGVQKLFSLSVIYRLNFVDLLSLFGIDLERIGLHQLEIRLPKTHPAKLALYNEDGTATFPCASMKV